jgi:CRISPR system Cascade subunit CasB
MAEQELSPQIQLFIEKLGRLDAGDRARLRRNAGRTLAEARNALGLFYRLLPPGVSEYQHATYFLVATIYPLAEGGAHGNLGESLRRARMVQNTAGLDRRIEILLDADSNQLPFRLRQVIHFLQSNRVHVNWPQLLADLLRWNTPSRPVQQRWARAYFTSPIQPKPENKGD